MRERVMADWAAMAIDVRCRCMTTRIRVQVRRIYDAPMPDDGARVLVDRLWPRGVSKARAHLDEWCKHIAPSTDLREWYHHDPKRSVSSPAGTPTSYVILSPQLHWRTCRSLRRSGH